VANYTDRLQLVIDAVTKGAQQQLGQLQGSLAKTDSAAETSTQKAGLLSKGWDTVKSSGLLAGASIATAGKIILDSVGDWTRLGKQVTDTAQALGVSAEEASRWIAVADDYEVSADQITGALLRVEKAAAAPAGPLKQLGIEVKKAADGSTDLTGTAEAIADHLASIHDPAQRAAEGVKIFGKGWAQIAPVFAHTGDELDSMLQSVSDSQVVTEEEAKSAEKMRLAQDRLNDSLGDLKLMLGETAAAFAPVVDALAQGVEWVGKVNSKIEDSGAWWTVFTDGVKGAANPIGDVVGKFTDLKDRLTGTEPKAKDTAKQITAMADAAGDAATKTQDLIYKYSALHDQLNFERDSLNMADSFQRVEDAAKESWQAAASGAENADQKARDYQRSIITAKDEAVKFLEKLGGIPTQKVTEILTLIDQGQYAEAQRQLDQLAKDRHAQILVKTVAQNTLSFLPGFGTSVPLTSAAAAAPMVGGRAAVAPAAAAVRTPIVVNLNAAVIGDPGAVAQAVTSALTRYQRLNGPRSVQLTKGGLG
jgi:hypothetical protein